jgi:hypothetical protein
MALFLQTSVLAVGSTEVKTPVKMGVGNIMSSNLSRLQSATGNLCGLIQPWAPSTYHPLLNQQVESPQSVALARLCYKGEQQCYFGWFRESLLRGP